MSKWRVKKCSVSADELTRFYGARKPLAYALYNRKIRDRDALKNYMDYEAFDFQNITDLKDVSKAFEIIEEAVNKNKKIYIYGDYDADGVMSTSIMYKGLKGLGADVNYFIPDRVEDGYGLNKRALKRIIDEGAELVITCDNGITAGEHIEMAKSMGVKTVILDHHEPPFKEEKGEKIYIIPNADAVVDAKIPDCGYKYTQMCAGGLCYRFICGLYEYMGERLNNRNELCELAAVATICDIVDLTGENRAIASKGLAIINNGSNNLGLRTLIELKNLENVTSYSVGFVIGPCINASGRLESAEIAVELFITENREKAKKLAEMLNLFNEERKNITQDGLERIVDNIEGSSVAKDRIIVVYDKNTHESVAGIIAGRLREKYGRPAIVLTRGEEGVKGSGRSVESYNMFEALCQVKELITKFGGHTMAAGLSLKEENVDELRKQLNEKCELTAEDMSPVLRMETVLTLEDISVESAEELNVLMPFGKGNEKPVYGIRNIMASNIKFVGKEGNVVSFIVDDGIRRVRAVDFDNKELWKKAVERIGRDIYIDAVFAIDINEYRGYKNPQMVIKDVRFLQ